VANFIEKIFHLEEKELGRYAKEADRVLALEADYRRNLSDEELIGLKLPEFKDRISQGREPLWKIDQVRCVSPWREKPRGAP
jgi:hypothetical protein